jgi:tyrosyl-tRNA synthetase
MKPEILDIFNVLKAGTATVIPEDALLKKLASGKKLIIKLGMDPTSPDLHLGHAVVLTKLRQFQDFGHDVIFLIGNFTAGVGDPTGKNKTRPPLSEQEIELNMRTYFEQVGRILDPTKVTIRYNAEWLDALSTKDLVRLLSKVTVARLIEREDFAHRLQNHQPIALHELLYPILQGYDSVALFADIELGGTDQTFNLLMGRYLQEQFHQEAQVIITTPLLEGLDGVQKMSKSLGNAIGLSEPAEQAYGKLMSISDSLMWRYNELLLQPSCDELKCLVQEVESGKLHPMTLKKQIAHAIITKFWSSTEAHRAQETFEALFQQKDYSKAESVVLPADVPNPAWIVDILKHLHAITTSSQAKRLLTSGAVTIDDQVIQDFKAYIAWKPGMVIKVGKHRIYSIKA